MICTAPRLLGVKTISTDRFDIRIQLRESTAETLALAAGGAALLVSGLTALAIFLTGNHQVPISGPGRSAGLVAAIVAASSGALAYGAGRFAVLRSPTVGPRVKHLTRRSLAMAVFDAVAVSLAHAVVIGAGVILLADIMSVSLPGAPVYALEGTLIVAVISGVSAYIAFSSAVHMSPLLLSTVLTAFLTMGAVTSMVTASDKYWWKENLSSLGTHLDFSGLTFNATLIVGGIVVASMARISTAGLIGGAFGRGPLVARWALLLLGVLLACVGIVPVNVSVLMHNTAATGMAVVFCALAVGIRWMMPMIPMAFRIFGWMLVAMIAGSSLLFALGYYNLTAVELVASIAVFGWIIVFLRVVGALDADVAADTVAEA